MQDAAFLLAIDTCGATGSVALGQRLDGQLSILAEKSIGLHRGSAELVSFVGELLSQAKLHVPQLSAIVAVNGPGSFTGVRVGLAAVKGLAESARIPVVAVSRLEVLARKAGILSAALDAHRNEVFLRVAEVAGAASELLAGASELVSIPPPARVALCEEAAAALLTAAWPATELIQVPAPTASDALLFGAARVDAGEFADLALLDGHYLRRSDAEIFGEAAGRAEKRAKAEAAVAPMGDADLAKAMEIAASLKELPRWSRENYLAALDPDGVPRRIALVVKGPDSAMVMGFLVATLMPPQAELEMIAVDARFQRRGLAGKLFQDFAGKAGQAGVTEVVLEARASNHAALAFYRFLGFAESGRRPRYYADPQEDAVLMKLQVA